MDASRQNLLQAVLKIGTQVSEKIVGGESTLLAIRTDKAREAMSAALPPLLDGTITRAELLAAMLKFSAFLASGEHEQLTLAVEILQGGKWKTNSNT